MTLLLDLMRHGEPVGGRRYRGQIDDPLSERGWSQMRGAIGEARPWSRIVSSPLLRCRAFAEEVATRHGLPLTLDDRLREIGFGAWEGKSAADIERDEPGALVRFKADPVAARPAGAETLDDFYRRVTAAFDAIQEACPDEHVLLVGHAGVIRMMLARALEIPQANTYRIEVAGAAFTRLRFEAAGRPTLLFHGAALPER